MPTATEANVFKSESLILNNMIRIIIQKKKSRSISLYSRSISLYKRIVTLKKELNLSWLDAIKLAYKLSKGYGVVINTAIASKQQCMYSYMDNLHNQLHRLFDTNWKQDVETVAMQIPKKDFDLFKLGGGYRVHIATKPGYIDHFLQIYP